MIRSPALRIWENLQRLCFYWSGRPDLNWRPPAPKAVSSLSPSALFPTAYTSGGWRELVEICASSAESVGGLAGFSEAIA